MNVDVDALKAVTDSNDARAAALKDYMSVQPSLLAEGVVLKDYQLLGINWLSLLHRRSLSCILADEMGKSTLFQRETFSHSLFRSWQDDPSHRLLVCHEGERYTGASFNCCAVREVSPHPVHDPHLTFESTFLGVQRWRTGVESLQNSLQHSPSKPTTGLRMTASINAESLLNQSENGTYVSRRTIWLKGTSTTASSSKRWTGTYVALPSPRCFN